jgi:hypothetical protein
VAKLKAARERKRLATGKCEGARATPRPTRRWCGSPKDCGGASAAIPCGPAAELAARGYVNVNGKEFSAASVASMLGAKA